MKKVLLNNSTSLDLPTLIDTRLLVQANSGGGKSWCIRRLLEQSHGQVQQIVIDLEGEFATLREKFDYILAGKGGDIPVNIQSASLLARRLLELNVSAIVDLYELPHYDRKIFVKRFLEAMIDAPKELWHPALVVIDEAHVFCPEKGQSEAMNAVIELCTRGRKRGYSAVLATQRLSKLSKDAAAECNNKLIGRTGLDVDMKRASDELGFTSKEQYLSLRALEAGEFFAFGPAISTEVIKVKIGEVQTTHPKAGARILATQPTAPTDKIKSILQRLTDLPKEAETEAKTIEDYKKQILELRGELRRAGQSEAKIDTKELEAIKREHKLTINKKDNHIKELRILLKSSYDLFKRGADRLETLPAEPTGLPDWEFGPVKAVVLPERRPLYNPSHTFISKQAISISDEERPIQGGALRMLQVLVSKYPMRFTKAQLATFSRLSPRSGTYGTYLSLLRSQGLIEFDREFLVASQKGIEFIGENPQAPESSEEIIEMWKDNLQGGAKRMFEYLVSCYPNAVSKEEVADNTGLISTSGTFGTYLSMLRSNGLIELENGMVKASENLFAI